MIRRGFGEAWLCRVQPTDTVRGAGDSVESQLKGRHSEHPSESVLKVIKERQRMMEEDELSDSEVIFGDP